MLVQGFRSDEGGCRFIYTVTLPSGTGLHEQLVEVDPATCRYVFARFEPTSDMTTSSSDLESYSTEQYTDHLNYGGTATATVSGDGSTIGTFSHDAPCSVEVGYFANAYQRIWHEDPALLTVTASTQFVEWSYIPDYCVQWLRSTSTSEWRPSTGWFLHAHLHPKGIPGDDQWRTVTNNGYSELRNYEFAEQWCFTDTMERTDVKYWPNVIVARNDGNYSASWEGGDYGACAYYLFPTRQIWGNQY